MKAKVGVIARIVVSIVLVGCFIATAGCSSSDSAREVNELKLDLNGISNITISYDEEPVAFFLSNGDELVIKEFMTENKSQYYAKVQRDGGGIHISEGAKPTFGGSFSRYIEVYFPQGYHENLTVTTTDGNIDISDAPLELSSLCIESTAGNVRLGSVDASDISLYSSSGVMELGNLNGERIRLETTSGAISCQALSGAVDYSTTSGDISVGSAAGSGSYIASNSGKLQIAYTEVTGDLTLFNKNDGISLKLPKELEFEFEANTKNGSISANFLESIGVEARSVRQTIGGAPTALVKAETTNGNIEAEQ